MFSLISKYTGSDDAAELCFKWYYQLHVIPVLFLKQMEVVQKQNNKFLFEVNGASIYVDLVENKIATDESIKVDGILAWIGHNKRIDFSFKYNNKNYTWSFRHTKANNMTEMYLKDFPRTNEDTSYLGRGVKATVKHDGVVFSCQFMAKLPSKLLSAKLVDGTNTIVVKDENPVD